jgi:hypothetical protein
MSNTVIGGIEMMNPRLHFQTLPAMQIAMMRKALRMQMITMMAMMAMISDHSRVGTE